jgi:predicted metal-dependent hydrolase
VKKAGKKTQGIHDKESFKVAVRDWSLRLKVAPTQVRMQKMKNKWASCSAKKWVSFSEDLLKEHTDFQQYVIVHELLHLRVPNHGKLFRSLLSLYVPNWEKLDNRSEREL